MLMKILGGLLVLILLLVGFIATRPAEYRVERSTTVAAPASVVQAQIEDFHRWPEWSPWAKLDPAMKEEHSGAERGVGAVYFWSGNDKVGEGRMTVVESVPGEKVGIKLEFLKPFAATNPTTFAFAPDGDGTKVTWTMEGKNDFIGKAMTLMMNMDKTVGGDFEKGLAQLKTVCESMPPAEAAVDSTASATAP